MKRKLDSSALIYITKQRKNNVPFPEIASFLSKSGYTKRDGRKLGTHDVYMFFQRKIKNGVTIKVDEDHSPVDKQENKIPAVKPVDVANYVWHLLPDARKEAIIASVIGKELI